MIMEEVLPPETAEGSGFERPFVRQFTIFLENKVGRLQALMRSLEQGVGVVAGLSIEESGDSDPDRSHHPPVHEKGSYRLPVGAISGLAAVQASSIAFGPDINGFLTAPTRFPTVS